MTNTALFLNMIARYNALAFTHHYIFGFTYKGNVYMTHASSALLPSILTLSLASRGAGMALRFSPTNAIKVMLLTSATLMCSAKFFNEQVAESKYNRGEIFEKMVTEAYGQEWHKDNVKFTDDGDMTANGIVYQIKFEKATFTNEQILAKLEK